MAPDDGSAGRRLALLVATATYADPGLAALRAPAGDVRSLAAVLGDDGIGGFGVRELIDRPTEELKREIEGFFGAGRPRDLLLLYVSGHGVLSQNRRFYFATATTALPLLRSTAIEDSFVNDVMQQSRARSIVLILDCCHSGAFGKGLTPKSTMSVDVEHRFEGRGRVTLTASTELEYAFEESTGINELGHVAPGSLFTRSVVEGLRSGDADIDEDGSISVDDLYDYVCRRIRDRSPNQTPGMAGDVRGQIVVARSPRRAALPAELARAVTSNLAGIREGAVSELERLLGAGGAEAAAARAALERLAEDDSRAVSNAALAALGRPPTQLVETRPEPERPPPPPPPPPTPRPRRWLVPAAGGAALVAAAVAAALLLGGGPETPGPVGNAVPYDFDGDSTQYVVLGLAQAAKAAGELHSGVVLAGEQGNDTHVLTGADAGVPGGDDENDRFGTAVASGDFDHDGTPDLAISAPGRRGVAILYGFRKRKQWIAASALPGVPQSNPFGFELVAARLNRDAYTDLAIGTPGTPGAVHILFGSAQGLRTDGARVIEPSSPSDENFGSNLRVGDISRDGNLDLVEGGEDATSAAGGHLSYCAGTPQGPKACRDLDGGPTTSLAIADVDGNGRLDVVQGDSRGTGRVQIWQGSKDGPTGPRATVDQDGPGMPGEAKDGDEFGHDVIAADLDGDHMAEVIVAARRDGSDQRGSVTLIKGAPDFKFQSARFLGYTAKGGAHLGATLSLLDADGDHHLDLFVGVKSATATADALVEYPGTKDGDLGAGAPWAGLKGLKVAIDRASPLRVGRE